MAWQTINLGPFRGLNQDENPHTVGSNELIDALNVVRHGSTLGTRPGTQLEASGKQYDAALTDAKAVTGMHEHRENVDSERHLLVMSKRTTGGAANIFHEHDAVLPTAGTITHDKDNIWTFATHNNKTWMAGGATSDSFFHWAGDTGVAPTVLAPLDSAGATLDPKYVFAWRNHLFINGLVGGVLSDNNPSATRFNEPNTDPTTAVNWKTGNTIGFNAFGKSFTTGFADYRDNNGDFLLILTNTEIASVELTAGFPFFKVTDAIQNGCVHQRAYVSLGIDAGDAVFMSDRGFHSLRQSQQHGAKANKFLSWKIRKLVQSLNKNRRKFTVGAYDFINGRVIFAVSTGSNTAHDTLVVLDIDAQSELTAATAQWYIWKMSGFSINELKMLRDEDDTWRMYFGTTAGQVGHFTDTVFSDIGSAGYTARFQTKHDDLGALLSTKTLGDVMITLQPGGSYQPLYRTHFDYGSRQSSANPLSMERDTAATWGPSGTGVFGVSEFGTTEATRDEKVYGRGSGRTISHAISNTGVNEPFRVAKISHQVEINGEDTGDVSNAA